MKSPWQVWSVFAICALVVLATMGWLSSQAMDADRLRSEAEWGIQREQEVSLALWRMDTKLAPLIAEEAARPYYFYDSFYAVDGPPTKSGASSGWAPSPLLFQNRSVRLNFTNPVASPQQWASPQVPSQEFNDLADENGLTAEQIAYNRRRLEELASHVDPQQLLAQLPKEQVPAFPQPVLAQRPGKLSEDRNQQIANSQRSYLQQANPAGDQQSQQRAESNSDVAQIPQQLALPQTKSKKGKGQLDFGQRSSRYQGAAQQEFAKQRLGNYYGGYGGEFGAYGGEYGNFYPTPAPRTSEKVSESLSQPLWVNGELLLARRIIRNDQEGVQGSWLDWSSIKSELLGEVADLFPNADLKPLPNPEDGDPSRMLAGLPVEFQIPHVKAIYLPSATLRWTLGLGWLALLVALAAVGALLWGVMALSERRAAFVSSVTHELRTPLTTFRMYSDMLARDMVPDAGRRQEYLATLQREAERLTHLVENVLSYARLERGRKPNVSEKITVGDLIDRQQTRLTERAQQAGMELQTTLPQGLRDEILTTDVGVVEQILFNLVDNAAKYAANAEDRRIHCSVERVNGHAEITIRDHGAGFDESRRARNPKPFSKSSEEAAVTAPGVGLGLALCRRFAAQLGGKLEIRPENSGAAVTLSLPLG